LNTIWNVAETKTAGVWWYVRTYLISLAGVVGLGFLLAISLIVSAGLAALSDRLGSLYSSIGAAFDLAASFAVMSVLFAMLFKWFPDTEIAWRDVVWGAVVTALLFNLGKFAIGWYIATLGLESTYGAATSLVIPLIWVYYSAQIVLFGAELTHAYAAQIGSRRMADVDAETPHRA
jgi:membrane protein